MKEPEIFFCADDWGLAPSVCQRIEDCDHEGKLDKISIFPNSAIPDERERIASFSASPSLHLNLVEGDCLSDPSEIPLLVTPDGKFRYSFMGLFLHSLVGKKQEWEAQVATELRAQIARFSQMVSLKEGMFLDSHQHTHMIPLIFRVLMRVIREDSISVRYLRIPVEPITPFLKEPRLYGTYSPINLVKQTLLRVLFWKNRRFFRESGIPTALFCGILFSGKMDETRVARILPHYLTLARKKQMNVELLFHPGVLDEEEKEDLMSHIRFWSFYRSPGRETEWNTLMKSPLRSKFHVKRGEEDALY